MVSHSAGRYGELSLTFRSNGQQTQLLDQYSRPPLQVMRGIPDAAGCMTVYLLSPSAGIVQGDRYRIHICLHPGAHALITTPSANRVYRMPDGCAQQTVHITVGAQAFLEYVPDATILYADAAFGHTTDVMLNEGAMLIVQDVVMPGRLAHQERLAFREYKTRLTAADAQGTILYEANRLNPRQAALEDALLLEGYPCWGSFFLLGDLDRRGVDSQRFIAQAQPLFADTPDAIGGISALWRSGVCARVLAHRLETITTLFEALRQQTRHALGLNADKLRKSP
jgi:urease accessory protein